MALLDDLAVVLGPGNDDAAAYAQAASVLQVLREQPHLAFSVKHGALWQDVCTCGQEYGDHPLRLRAGPMPSRAETEAYMGTDW